MAINIGANSESSGGAYVPPASTPTSSTPPTPTPAPTPATNFGPAVIITISQPIPDETVVVTGTRPPATAPTPDETVTVYGQRKEPEEGYYGASRVNPSSAAAGGASFSGWAETDGGYGTGNYGGASSSSGGDPVEPPKPDEIVNVIANKLAPPPAKDAKDPALEYALEKIFDGQNGGAIDVLYEGPDLVHTSPGPNAPKPIFTPPTSLPSGYTPVGDQGKFMKGEDGKIYFTNEYARFMQDAHAYGMTDWEGFWLDMASIGFGMAAWEVIGAKNIGLLFGGALLEYIRGGHQER